MAIVTHKLQKKLNFWSFPKPQNLVVVNSYSFVSTANYVVIRFFFYVGSGNLYKDPLF